MKYYLYNYENGREHLIAQGSTKESVRSIVENSPDFFKNGYAIYEANVVVRGPDACQR